MPYRADSRTPAGSASSSSSSSLTTPEGSSAGSNWFRKGMSSSSEKHEMLQQLQDLTQQNAADEVR
jgi:hypothetical protein